MGMVYRYNKTKNSPNNCPIGQLDLFPLSSNHPYICNDILFTNPIVYSIYFVVWRSSFNTFYRTNVSLVADLLDGNLKINAEKIAKFEKLCMI